MKTKYNAFVLLGRKKGTDPKLVGPFLLWEIKTVFVRVKNNYLIHI